MKLTAIYVSGFRNVSNTRIALNGIIGLVSPNNYGKTNLLEAIDFGIAFINSSQKSRRELMSHVAYMPLNPSMQNEPFTFGVEFDDEELGDYRYVKYSYSFEWYKDDHTGQRIVDEKLEANAQSKGMWSNYLKRSKSRYRPSHAIRSFRKIRLDDDQLAIDVLTSVDDLEIGPVIRRIRQIEFDAAYAIETGNRFNANPFEFSSESDNFAFDADDVASQLARLRRERPEAYELFESAVYELFPEFEAFSIDKYQLGSEERARIDYLLTEQENLPFKIRDELYRITVKSKYINQSVNVTLMSAGTRRMIWLIANVIIASNAIGDQLLGIEEPETSVHPRMIKDLLIVLNEALGATPLLITSHSPYLVQYLKLDCVYIGIPNDEGIACFKKIPVSKREDILNAARKRGMGFGEYLFSLMASQGYGSEILSTYLED